MFEIHILKDCSIQQMIALVSFTVARRRYCLLFWADHQNVETQNVDLREGF